MQVPPHRIFPLFFFPSQEHVLSIFADPGAGGDGEGGKCTRVSMRDYIKKMK